ncbi:MAG: cytochrome c [Phycisphaerae bacterium]|nr:cytochrome c [Phycisphaerae bacterium]
MKKQFLYSSFVSIRAHSWTVCALIGGMAVVGCRKSDMSQQPRFQPYQESVSFSDNASERPLVAGTVIHGQPRTDELLYQGTVNGRVSTDFPFQITHSDLERGRVQFNIFCSVCHGQTGEGNGMIVQRGFTPPPSYHIDRLRNAPVGHFFQVISNGYGAMYSYNERIKPDDRWRIAAYIRALQLSQNAPPSALSDDQKRAADKAAIVPKSELLGFTGLKNKPGVDQ